MITEAICSMFFGLIEIAIGSISVSPGFVIPSWGTNAAALLGRALFFFPVDVWAVCIGSFLFWTAAQFAYAVAEWVWKKIPGVN